MNYAELGLHDLFKIQAAKTPDVPAIVGDRKQTSYRRLDQETDALAAYLRSLGVSADDPVGIFMETCPEYIVASLGILKAGAAFMPISLDSPDNLLGAIFSESQPRAVITKAGHLTRLSRFSGTPVFPIDSDGSWRNGHEESGNVRFSGDNLAFPSLHLRHDRGSEGSDADRRLAHIILLRTVQVQLLLGGRPGSLQYLLSLGVSHVLS